jgi:hypothetical protein
LAFAAFGLWLISSVGVLLVAQSANVLEGIVTRNAGHGGLPCDEIDCSTTGNGGSFPRNVGET